MLKGYTVQKSSTALGLSVAGVYLLWRLLWNYKFYQNRKRGRELYAKRQAKTYQFELAHLSKELINRILESDVTHLREGLMKREYTSRDLVSIFASRVVRISRELNLHTDELFEEALAEADQKDAERSIALKEGKQDKLPMLHGIPISVKD